MNTQALIDNKPFYIMPFILIVMGVVILISLGTWQLYRLKEKKHFITSIEHNINNPALTLDKINHHKPIYSKINISGKFLADKNIFLYGRRSASPEKDGYYLLSVFEANDGKTYLVSRGWIPHSLKNKLNEFAEGEIKDKFDAIILPGEKKQFMVPENDNSNHIWFTIDLNMAKNILGITEDKFYLMQIASSTLPMGGKSLTPTHLNKVRNNHLEYAITWYSLAAGLIIIYLISRKRIL